MKLYYSEGACSLSPHIVAREANIPIELEKVELGQNKTEKGKTFSDVNPKGYVPALELDDGSLLTEGAVIVQYLADKAPASGLIPAAGTLERYRLQEWLNFIATEVHKGFSPLWGDGGEETKKAAKEALAPKFQLIVDALQGKKFLTGDRFTVADAYAFTVLSWAKYLKVELPAPLNDYLGRVAARPAVQTALKAENLV